MSVIAKQHKVDCPECGAPMRLRESRHGLFYGCTKFPECKGAHGAHPDGKPLGTPADVATKQARIALHAVFDSLWKGSSARMTRGEAYLHLQSKMGMTSEQAHIGSFTKEQCERAIAALSAA